MSFYGVKAALTKTDCQIINKECFEDVHGNKRCQLINLQSKACNSQDTTSWNAFFWVGVFMGQYGQFYWKTQILEFVGYLLWNDFIWNEQDKFEVPLQANLYPVESDTRKVCKIT